MNLQINGRKPNESLITCVHGKDHPQLKIEKKKKTKMLEVWFEFSEGRKAVYMKMENKMFSKQMFSGCTETVGHRTELEEKNLPRFLPVYNT